MCFDPDLCTTGQRLVWRVDHGAWAVNRDPVAFRVALTRLYSKHRKVCTFAIGADVVLINVNPCDHLKIRLLFGEADSFE